MMEENIVRKPGDPAIASEACVKHSIIPSKFLSNLQSSKLHTLDKFAVYLIIGYFTA